MFKGQIKTKRLMIERVIVARLFASPLQKAQILSPHGYAREPQYRYLLLFLPKADIPASKLAPSDYFIFVNKADRPNEIRWYKSLFTVSQDITEWGFKSFDFIDLTEFEYLEDAFAELKRFVNRKKLSIKPAWEYLLQLSITERKSSVCLKYECRTERRLVIGGAIESLLAEMRGQK